MNERQQRIFFALADPIRNAIVANLAENSPKTATQLAEEYPITRPGIRKHLDILKDAGLVQVHQHGREKRYTFSPKPLSDIEAWMEDITAKWDGRLDRLKSYLESGEI